MRPITCWIASIRSTTPTSETRALPFTASVTLLIQGGRKRRSACGKIDVGEALREAEADRLARLHLAVMDRLDGAARDLDHLRRREHRSAPPPPRRSCDRLMLERRQPVVDREDQHQDRDAADDVAVAAHQPAQRRRAVDQHDARAATPSDQREQRRPAAETCERDRRGPCIRNGSAWRATSMASAPDREAALEQAQQEQDGVAGDEVHRRHHARRPRRCGRC